MLFIQKKSSDLTQSSLSYFLFKHLSLYPCLKNAVFTRSGGTSLYPYESLNLGIHVGDNQCSVISNRERVLQELGFKINNLIAMEQIHSDNLEEVTFHDAGRGACSWDDAIHETDALICKDRGVILMAVVADCAVAVFYDPQKEVIAIAHCGWRGTVKKLAVKVLGKMEENFNCNSSDILVGVTPCIDMCCYEVGEEVLSDFHNSFGDRGETFFEHREGKLYLNLKKAIKFQLLERGIKEKNLEISDLCTCCRNDLFFSHRAEHGKTGRSGVMIGIL